MKYSVVLVLFFFVMVCCATAVEIGDYDSPGMGNPLVAGYFADPTVCQFGDTFYIYATTDGTAAGNGPSQV